VIRTVLFDLGNVLVHFSNDRMLRQVGKLCGQSAEFVHRVLFDSGLQADFERGRLTEATFHERFERAVGRSMDAKALHQAASDIFELNGAMLPVVDALRRHRIRLVLLSNTCVTHFTFLLEQFPVLQTLDDYVVSFEVGAAKPEPEIFEAALRKIHCVPQECYFTDDLEANVLASRSFGLQAEVFTNAQNFLNQLCQRGLDLGV